MHIQKKSIEIFEQNEKMSASEMIDFLEHLEQCDFCLEQMLKEEENSSPAITAPAYPSEEILEKAASFDVQTPKIIRTASRRTELFHYRLRTAAGVAAALVLLFLSGHVDFTPPRPVPAEQTADFSSGKQAWERGSGLAHFSRAIGSGISSGSDKLSDYLRSFPNKIFKGGE